MDKKKRNSILRPAKDDDGTVEINLRYKQRRISFSEKKSIRVFCGEEEPKNWDKTYDLSDRAETSNNSATKSITPNENNSLTASALYTTDDFINKTLHGTPQIDHTLEISLLEHEKINLYSSTQPNQLKKVTTNIIQTNKNLPHKTQSENKENIQTNLQKANENSNPQNTNTNTAMSELFTYINENSNKENIAPQLIGKKSSTKTSDEKHGPSTAAVVKTNFEPNDQLENDSISMKKPKITIANASTITYTNSKDISIVSKSESVVHYMQTSPNTTDVSGITAFDKTTSFELKSEENSISSYVPAEYLTKSSKKLDFRQLNEIMQREELNIFPRNPCPQATSTAQSKKVNDIDVSLPGTSNSIAAHCSKKTYKERRGTIIFNNEDIPDIECDINEMQSLTERPNVSNYNLSNIDETQSIVISNNQRNYEDHLMSKEINESIKKSQFHTKRRTNYSENCEEIEIETTKHLEEENYPIFAERTPMRSQLLPKGRYTHYFEDDGGIEIETTATHTEEENNPGPIPMRSQLLPKGRYTHYFEDDGGIEIETTATHTEDENNPAPTPMRSYLFKKGRFTNHFENDREIETTATHSGAENNPAPTSMRLQLLTEGRYTHYFEKDGGIEIETIATNTEKENNPAPTLMKSHLLTKGRCTNRFESDGGIQTESTATQTEDEINPAPTPMRSYLFKKGRFTNHFENDREIEIETTATHSEGENNLAPTPMRSQLLTKGRYTHHFENDGGIEIETSATHMDEENNVISTQPIPKNSELQLHPKGRYTNFFENDGGIEIETSGTHMNEENNVISTQPIPKNSELQFHPKGRYTNFFENDAGIEIESTATHTKDENNSAPTPMRSQLLTKGRYTHHFENDGGIEIETSATQMIEENNAISTQPIPKNSELQFLPKGRYTNFFENNGKIEIEPTKHLKQENLSQISFEIKGGTSPEVPPNFKYPDFNNYSKFNTSRMDLSIAKREVSQKFSTANKRKTVMFSETINDIEMTPVRDSNPLRPLRKFVYSPATPRRSILEFEQLEREIAKDKENNTLTENVDYSVESVNMSKKRPPINLTPNFSQSKKRQPHPCNSFDMDLTLNNEPNLRMKKDITNENVTLHDADPDVKETNNTEFLPKRNEICARSFNAEQQQTPCRSGCKSRIPLYTAANPKTTPLNSSRKMHSIRQLDYSLDTIQVPRFDLSTNVTNNFLPEFNISKDITLPKPPKKCIFENDNPITISDVSEHYLSQTQRQTLNPVIKQTVFDHKNKTAVESMLEIIESDAIEATKIDLVESFLESEFDTAEPQPSTVVNESNKVVCEKKNATTCRKCRKCQESILNETVSTDDLDSLVMPELPPMPTIRLDLIEKYRNGPSVTDLPDLFDKLGLFEPIDIADTSVKDDTISEEIEDPFFEMYRNREREIEENFKRPPTSPVVLPEPFVVRLRKLMRQPSMQNWILNVQMQKREILRLSHRKINTIFIILQYEKKNEFGIDVSITRINIVENARTKRMWVPFDHILDFQLKLVLPSEMLSLCAGNSESDVVNMLQKVDGICLETVQLARELWGIAYRKDATLIREGFRNFVQLFARRIVAPNGFYEKTETVEFRIEITNIKSLSFKDVTKPALHNFQEVIRNISPGLHFLNKFLDNPMQYLKDENVH